LAQPPAALEFAGFAPEACAFFRSLARNNNRDWFQSRKELFERTCRAPLMALTIALDPPLGASRITRIHRDVRFSRDKSPYHTHISTIVRGNYLALSADGLYVGTGMYMPEPATLRRLRQAIDADASGRQLADIVASLRRKGYTVASHETVASMPRGFRADHPRVELLRMKDIHGGKTLEPATLGTAKAVRLIERVIADIAPLQQWLKRHVGSTRGS
jgi:uncharacterized protein (TIGR02453 family)